MNITLRNELLLCCSVVNEIMGVNHGGRGDKSPLGFGVGDAHENRLPDFVMFQHFKHQTACIHLFNSS